MKAHIKLVIGFVLIMFFWFAGSGEMYLHKTNLHSATTGRYLIYFLWIVLVAVTGFFTLNGKAQLWQRKIWVLFYGSSILLLLALGMLDLFVYHFTKQQKNYIQTFRLFLESPVPLVIIYLTGKLQPGQHDVMPAAVI